MSFNDLQVSNSSRAAINRIKGGNDRFWLAALLIVGGVFFHRSYLVPGTINWGDFYWISPATLHSYFRWPSMWEPMWGMGNTNGQINIGPIYSLMALMGKVGISAAVSERILIWWPMAFLPFVSMYWLLGRFNVRPAARAAGAFVFGANTYMATRGIQHPFIVLGASACPLVWRTLLDSLDMLRAGPLSKMAMVKRIVLVGSCFALTLLYDVRMAGLGLLVSAIFIALALRNSKSRLRIAVFSIGALCVSGALHAYWVLPSLLGNASSSFGGKLPDTPFLNFWSLAHSLALSEPYYTGSEPVWFSKNAVMLPLLAFPLLAFGGFLVARKKNTVEIGVFTAVAILGVALTKGQNPPFGAWYDWSFSNIPGLQLFRDSSKFAVLTAAGYSVLIAICLNRCANWWQQRDDDGRDFSFANRQLRLFPDRRSQIQEMWESNATKALAILCVGAFVIASVYSTRGSITDRMGGTSRLHEPPAGLDALHKTIDADPAFGRQLWFPHVDRWSSISETHPVASTEDLRLIAGSLSMTDADRPDEYRLLVTSPNFNQYLSLGGVKYIVVNDDIRSEMWDNTAISVPAREQFLTSLHAALAGDSELQQIPTKPGVTAYKFRQAVTKFAIAPTKTPINRLPVASKNVGQDQSSLTNIPVTGATTVIQMSEIYNGGWDATVKARQTNGKTVSAHADHVELADGNNGWVVTLPPGTQSISAEVKYKPQAASKVGFVVSLVLLAAFAVVGLITLGQRKRPRREIRTTEAQPVLDLSELDRVMRTPAPIE